MLRHLKYPNDVTIYGQNNAPTVVQINRPLPEAVSAQGVQPQRTDCRKFAPVGGVVHRVDDAPEPGTHSVTPKPDGLASVQVTPLNLPVSEFDFHRYTLPMRASTQGRIMSMMRSRGSASFLPSSPTG